MANRSGYNGFPGFIEGVPYGSKKKQGDLQRMAPFAGEQQSASNLDAARRAQRRARTGNARAQTPAQQPAAAPQPGTEPIAAGVGQQSLYEQIAQIPGVTPTWSEILG